MRTDDHGAIGRASLCCSRLACAGKNLCGSMYGGDGGVCAADPSDFNYFYGEYTNLDLHRSSDGGQ